MTLLQVFSWEILPQVEISNIEKPDTSEYFAHWKVIRTTTKEIPNESVFFNSFFFFIMLQNGQTYFKNFAVFNIMKERVNNI